MGQAIMKEESNSGYKLPLVYTDKECFGNTNNGCKRLKIILVEKGSGNLILKDYQVVVTAPAILCIKENDMPEIDVYSQISARSIYFDPWAVNGKFNYTNIRDEESNFSITEQQDLYLIRAFTWKDYKYYNISIPSQVTRQISRLFDDACKVISSTEDIFWPCRSRSVLLEILVLITRIADNNDKYTGNADEKESAGRVNEVIAYLQTNYRNKLTLNELARTFNTNRTTLNEEFYKETNQSIIDYLIKYRMNLAAALLRDTMLPVSDIMERVGYNDTSHFWRMFKKTAGMSPSEYRKRYCWVE